MDTPKTVPKCAVVVAIILLILGAGLCAADADAPPTPPTQEGAGAAKEPLVSNVFFDTDLRQALSDVSAQTGVIIIPTEDVQGMITMELKDMPLEKALELMCMPGGFVYKEIADNTWLVGAPDPQSPAFRIMAEVEIVDLQHLSGKELESRLPTMYEEFCKFDELGNQVIVTAPNPILEQTCAMLRRLDQPLLQIMIEALVVETNASRLKDFYAKAQATHVGMDGTTGLMTYTSLAKDLLAEVLSLVERREAQTKANPSVVAQEGRTAKVEVSTEQYFTIITGPTSYPYTTLQQIDADISLEITPLVAEETGDVTIELKPTVSDVTGQGANNLPIITKRSAETTIRVKDGQVIAIGGLLEELDIVSRRKIPLLGDIPIIGGLFRSTERSRQLREVVIFIVPHILDPDSGFQGPRLLESPEMLGKQMKPWRLNAPSVGNAQGDGQAKGKAAGEGRSLLEAFSGGRTVSRGTVAAQVGGGN